MPKAKPVRIGYIINTPYFFYAHLRHTVAAILNEGYELHLIFSTKPTIDFQFPTPNLKIHLIQIEREISPFRDLISLVQLIKFFLKTKVQLIHSYTPKAGLLSALAAFICRAPIRLHTFTGQTWATRSGFSRKLLMNCDKLILNLNTKCYTDSFAQVETFKINQLISHKNLYVLGHGSIAGANKEVFDPNRWDHNARHIIREGINIPNDAFVLNFTGRLVVEKGLCELFTAFKNLVLENSQLYWIIVGPREEGSSKIPDSIWNELNTHPKIRVLGYSDSPEKFYAISNLFCIPSYREGFGSVVIESAMMKLPTVGTDIAGLNEIIIDNQTGLLVPVKNAEKLQKALKKIIEDSTLRTALAENAYQRAIQNFNQKDVIKRIIDEYADLQKSVAA